MRAPEGYAARLSYYGDALVRNPQGHHGWVDQSYFPELSAADPRFDADLDILKQDHKSLDGVLATFTSSANMAIKLIQLDEVQTRDEAGQLASPFKQVCRGLCLVAREPCRLIFGPIPCALHRAF